MSRAATAISSIGLPPSDQSEWVWQSPQRGPQWSAVGQRGTFQLVEVGRFPSRGNVVHHRGGGLADAAELGERAAGDPVGQLVVGQALDDTRGFAERPHPVGGRARPFELEGDLPQRPHRIHGHCLPDPRTRRHVVVGVGGYCARPWTSS